MDVTFWLGCLFSVLGLAIIIQQQFLKYKVRASQTWPSIDGEIVRSEVICKGGAPGGGTTFKADIKYKYQVKARRYKGKNVCLNYDVATGDRGRAEQRCAEYPVGRTATVYYNPNNFADACLERRADAPVFIIIIAGAFMFFGLCMILGFFN